MSIKRRIKDLKSFNYHQGIEVLTLRNQGWTYQAIADKLGITHQRARAIYKNMAGITVEEAELLNQCLSNLPIA